MESRYWDPLKRSSITVLIVVILAGILSPRMKGQEVASNLLPDAPVPHTRVVKAVLESVPVSPKPAKHKWLNLNNASIAALVIGEGLDSWSTHENLSHAKWICGYSPAFGNSVTYISNDGNRYDAPTIQNVLCGPAASGQLANYAYDVTRTGAYTETGWVTKAHLAGNRDFARVAGWNVANDIGQFAIARYLGKRKAIARLMGPGMNLSHGIVHLQNAVLNFRFARNHQNATSWRFNLPNEAQLYPGPRWWGRQ